ncbi:hypothetical protein K457DRAFT_13185 [Linnemannia elongata AG-77]|uniref:Uncharacterized protein n=1 Tax=Linnemannia elongata AG-77 TaxID=1314771 RepID=A0A197KFK8_9FUNG|nr:hypothetical protein K457DRAFT_13185 [Linnemannia elongata AG-77]
MMSELDDSDNELPSYSSAIGPSGLASPRRSYPGQPALMMGGKVRRSSMLDDDDDDDDEATLMSGHISEYPDTSAGPGGRFPEMSDCASNGSNPGTANGSPAHFPITLDAFSCSGSVLGSCGALGLTSISHTGGRIDESDHRNDEYDEYVQLGSGVGILPRIDERRVILATTRMAMETRVEST